MFIVSCLVMMLAVKGFLHNKIIGMISHPGLQGEILFQKIIVYNFEKGDLFQYFYTDYLNYPFGENLGFGIANSLHLFLYIPLKFFFGIIASYNMLVIITFMLNFLSVYLLARYLFTFRSIALCVALVFALNPYVLLKMNLGFVQKYTLFWIPLYFLFLFKLQKTQKWHYVIKAGFGLAFMQFTYPPYACYAVICTSLLLVYSLLNRKELWFAFSRFVSIVMLHFFFTSLIYYLLGFGFVYYNMKSPEVHFSIDGNLDIVRLFRFHPYLSMGYPREYPLGISFVAFLLAVIALLKHKGIPRLLFFVMVVFILIAAGPYLIYDGKYVQFFGHKIILLFYLIAQYIPYAKGIFFPIRVFPFIYICLALLVGYALSYLLSMRKTLKPSLVTSLCFAIYVLEQIILFPQLFPPRVSDVHVPRFYQQLQHENCEAILNLPISCQRHIINRYGFYAALSGKKMMNSYHNNALSLYVPKDTDDEETKEDFIRLLAQWKVGYIVIHKNFLNMYSQDTTQENNGYAWFESLCQSSQYYPEDNLLVYKISVKNKSPKTRQSKQHIL